MKNLASCAFCCDINQNTNLGDCFTASGSSLVCNLGGTNYNYAGLSYGTTTGWIADNFLQSSEQGCGAGVCVGIDRSGWGARPPTSVTPIGPAVSRVFIHHTAGNSCFQSSDCMASIRSIQNYHMDTNGWNDIGYNFLVGEDGNAYEGRGWDTVGAHTAGYNTGSIGISVLGTFSNSNPNSAAMNRVQELIACGVTIGKIRNDYTLHGHSDTKCTQCPGATFHNTIQGWDRFGGASQEDAANKLP